MKCAYCGGETHTNNPFCCDMHQKFFLVGIAPPEDVDKI